MFNILQSDTIFNWYWLAFEKDNQYTKEKVSWEESYETQIFFDTITELFDCSVEDIREELEIRK